MTIKKLPKTFRFICILDSLSADYLHIHILDSSYLEPLEDFSRKLSANQQNCVLYQWGNLQDLEKEQRKVKVLAREIKKSCNIGIGSCWKGSEKKGGIGGGEAFLFDSQNFRITKGNEVFKVKDEQGYWNFQQADFNGAQKFSTLEKISGREELKNFLLKKTGNKAFVATFDAEFSGDFFARSNGIFPEDNVKNPAQSLFEKEINGGHLVGGSNNTGDLKSLKQRFDENEAALIDFSFYLRSEILLKSHDKIVEVAS
jgi:hypothetical protein